MSASQHFDAVLVGHAGPHYPPAVGALNNVFTRQMSHRELKPVAATIPGYTSYQANNISTRDGYRWYAQLGFVTSKDRVHIMVPWFTFRDHHGIAVPERSVAAYSINGDEVTVNAVAEQLCEAWTAHLTQMIDDEWRRAQETHRKDFNSRWHMD